MRLVSEAEYFAGSSAGLMVRGRQWFHGSLRPDRRFYVLFGDIDANDIAGLIRMWVLDMVNGHHYGLLDAAGLTSVTFEAFSAVSEFAKAHAKWLGENLQRQALVRPSALAGAVIAGYYGVFPPPYEYKVCATRSDALAWLDYPPNTFAAVDALMQTDPLITGLRQLLEKELRPALDRHARALGVSTRTLQRRLLASGTSFSAEVTRAQLNRAMFLLRHSDEKISAIADKVGCSSLASFSEMFTREVGVRPSEWRATHAPERARG